MSIGFLGKDRLGAILDETQRIIVSNRTTTDNGVTINAVSIGLHSANGSVHFRTLTGTPLGPTENIALDDDRPTEEQIVGLEAFIRLSGQGLTRIVDTYVKLDIEGEAITLGDVELGVSEAGDSDVSEASIIEEAPDFVVFVQRSS